MTVQFACSYTPLIGDDCAPGTKLLLFRLTLGSRLGEGEFGLVFASDLRDVQDGQDVTRQVAVKMLKGTN